MSSSPILSVLEESQVSPPPATVTDGLLPLTFLDFRWLKEPPVHNLFFYELSITKPHFIHTIIPDLKRSLSTTLQHFFPFAGNLIVFPTSAKHPEIRYVEGDSVTVTFAECNLDFNQLTGNQPRDCALFYHLTPRLPHPDYETSGSTKIPVFSVQVTLFSNTGICIGLTNLHCLGDASTRFHFMQAWTSISRFRSDESFLADGNLPVYDRLVNYPKFDESYLKSVHVEKFKEEYTLAKLCGPTDKVRGTFVLPRNVLSRLKLLVSTELPRLEYVSSFTVACGYIWSCIAGTRKQDELQLLGFPINCRARMNPPIPATFFGNCIDGCIAMENTKVLTGKEGFLTAAKLIGKSLHKALADKDGVLKDVPSVSVEELFAGGMPRVIGVTGSPKFKFYEMDFGWGKARKIETVSIDYSGSISVNACKERSEDLEIGVCLSAMEMEAFIGEFEDGWLKSYI